MNILRTFYFLAIEEKTIVIEPVVSPVIVPVPATVPFKKESCSIGIQTMEFNPPEPIQNFQNNLPKRQLESIKEEVPTIGDDNNNIEKRSVNVFGRIRTLFRISKMFERNSQNSQVIDC